MAHSNKPVVSGIVERGMLVDLTVNRYAVSRKDKRVTEHVREEFAASGDVGRYNKRLWPHDPPEAKKVASIANQIQVEHRRMTLPWTQNGWRILSRDMHADYSAAMQHLRREYETAVKEMADRLPHLVADAKKVLGKMFDPADYPEPREFISSHGVTIKFMPVPDAGDFRINLDADTMKELREAYEADMHSYLQTATRDAWERLHGVIEALVKACDRVDERQAAEERVVMKSAVIDNVLELTAVLPKLNVAEDSHLEAIRQEVVQKLGKLKASELREDMAARAAARKDAAAIMRKMGPFMAQQGGGQ